jgi:hypothetical protein
MALSVELLEQIERGNILLFVGDGIGNGQLPSATALADELAARCDYPSDEPRTLTHVAGYYELTRGRNGLVQFLRERLDTTAIAPSRAHQLIAGLQAQVIIAGDGGGANAAGGDAGKTTARGCAHHRSKGSRRQPGACDDPLDRFERSAAARALMLISLDDPMREQTIRKHLTALTLAPDPIGQLWARRAYFTRHNAPSPYNRAIAPIYTRPCDISAAELYHFPGQ